MSEDFEIRPEMQLDFQLLTEDAFRLAFRRHAAGVTVITTTLPDGSPTGFTATSLASLSAEPPLATFNIAQTSSSWPAIRQDAPVAIHILGSRNRELAARMAADSRLRFGVKDWEVAPSGVPVFPTASAILLAHIFAVTPVADSAMVAVQIDVGSIGDPDEPLLYYERDYHRLRPLADRAADAASPNLDSPSPEGL